MVLRWPGGYVVVEWWVVQIDILFYSNRNEHRFDGDGDGDLHAHVCVMGTSTR